MFNILTYIFCSKYVTMNYVICVVISVVSNLVANAFNVDLRYL